MSVETSSKAVVDPQDVAQGIEQQSHTESDHHPASHERSLGPNGPAALTGTGLAPQRIDAV